MTKSRASRLLLLATIRIEKCYQLVLIRRLFEKELLGPWWSETGKKGNQRGLVQGITREELVQEFARFKVGYEVDRITATALGLAADRAIATLVRVRVGAGEAERHGAAMAGSFKLHGLTPDMSM